MESDLNGQQQIWTVIRSQRKQINILAETNNITPETSNKYLTILFEKIKIEELGETIQSLIEDARYQISYRTDSKVGPESKKRHKISKVLPSLLSFFLKKDLKKVIVALKFIKLQLVSELVLMLHTKPLN